MKSISQRISTAQKTLSKFSATLCHLPEYTALWKSLAEVPQQCEALRVAWEKSKIENPDAQALASTTDDKIPVLVTATEELQQAKGSNTSTTTIVAEHERVDARILLDEGAKPAPTFMGQSPYLIR